MKLAGLTWAWLIAMTFGATGGQLSLQEFIDTAPQADLTRSIIGASGETYTWVNIRLRRQGKPPFFCPPEDLAISDFQYVQILKSHVKAQAELGKVTWQYYPNALLDGLIKAFPCRGGGPL